MQNCEADTALPVRWYEVVNRLYHSQLIVSPERYAEFLRDWIVEFRAVCGDVAKLCVAYDVEPDALIAAGRNAGVEFSEGRRHLRAKLVGLTTDELDHCGNLVAKLQCRIAFAANREVPLTADEQRSKFCFEEWQRGQTLKQINAALKKHPEWDQFEDDKSVRGPIIAWGKRIGVSPRTGQRGRPKSAK